MADVAGGNGGNGFWDLDTLSSVANLFLIFVVASAVPALRWIWKRNEDRRQKARQAEDDRIIKIVQEYVGPLESKMDAVLKNQNVMYKKVKYIDGFFKKKVTFGEMELSEEAAEDARRGNQRRQDHSDEEDMEGESLDFNFDFGNNKKKRDR